MILLNPEGKGLSLNEGTTKVGGSPLSYFRMPNQFDLVHKIHQTSSCFIRGSVSKSAMWLILQLAYMDKQGGA